MAAQMESPAEAPRLSEAETARVLQLLRKVDSVELKATVPLIQHRATIAALSLDPVEAQPRQVFFLDTPDLALDAAGMVVRARRIQGGRADSVVKLRPLDPDTISSEIRKSASFTVEVDALPGGYVCSGTLKGRPTTDEVRDAVAGKAPLRRVLSKEQRTFFAAHAPEGVELDALSVLGPVYVLKATFQADLSGRASVPARRMVAEMWLYPDGSRILELSTKCLPEEAFQVAAETRAYLAAHGVSLGAHQETKTRAALDHFRAQLDQGGEA
jgi:hypothetical protein